MLKNLKNAGFFIVFAKGVPFFTIFVSCAGTEQIFCMKRVLRAIAFNLLLLFSFQTVLASVPDSLYERIVDLYRNSHQVAGIGVAEPDEGFIRRLEFLLHRPLDVNSSERTLEKSGLFSQWQLASLSEYRSRYGDVLTATELALIPGFGKDFTKDISPFVTFRSDGRFVRRWEHGTLIRVKSRLGKDGFLDKSLRYVLEDSPFGVGMGLGYSSRARDFSVQNLSMNISLDSPAPWLSCVVVGDYNLRFGQGGLLWSSFAMNSLSGISDAVKLCGGVIPYCTLGSGVALRGIAATFALGDIDLSPFFSYGKLFMDGDVPSVAGVNALWRFTSFQLAASALWEQGGPVGVSADFKCMVAGVLFAGEFAWSSAPGVWLNTDFRITERWKGGCSARYVHEDYDARLAAPFSADSTPGNEAGIMVTFTKFKGIVPESVLAADLCIFPKIVRGSVCQIKCRGEWNAEPLCFVGSLKFRDAEGMSSSFRSEWHSGVVKGSNATGFRHSVRADLSVSSRPFGIGRAVSFEEGFTVKGRYSPVFSVYAGVVLYHCDNWQQRIYCYERDLYGSFYVPALYGRGGALSVVLSWKPLRWLKLSAKAALRMYERGDEKEKAGYADLKFQCELSF